MSVKFDANARAAFADMYGGLDVALTREPSALRVPTAPTPQPNIDPEEEGTMGKDTLATAIDCSSIGVQAAVVVVTPNIAKTWLSAAAPNRRLAPPRVASYARDMARGAWSLNGETIKLDDRGRVIDGIHRLNAVVQADTPVRMLVVSGVHGESIATIDAGRTRSFADYCKIEGHQNAGALAAAAAWLFRYEHGLIESSAPLSHPELREVLEAHPQLARSVGMVGHPPNGVPTAALAFVHFMASRRNAALADEFVHMVKYGTKRDGGGLGAEHPAHVLRERLIAQSSSKFKLQRTDVLALCIKAWNHLLHGRAVRNLRWRSGGDSPEVFPSFSEAT